MNSRERVKLALSCRKPDRIPVALGFFPQSIDSEFNLDVRYAEFNAPKEQKRFLSYLSGLPEDIHMGSAAQLQTYFEWDYHPESNKRNPLASIKSLDELKEYALPDLTHPDRYKGLAKKVSKWHKRGFAVAGSPPHLGGVMFEIAMRLRGFERFLMDMVARKELVHFLLEQLSSLLTHNALILAQSGVDILILDDDVAGPTNLLISPAMWREYFKRRLARVINLAREEAPDLLVFYHCDGNFTQLIPDLIEIGVNVINPIQPDCMDALKIKQEFGDKIAMWGAVGTARLWTQGTPDQIRAETKLRMETLGPEGVLLAPAYDIDYVPKENIRAFVETVLG